MFAEFYITLIRNDEEVDALVEYSASCAFGDVDVEITSVTIDGVEVDTSADEDKRILDECFGRVDEDFQADADAYADYRYEMSREDY
jgi:hypothetical protein